MRRLAFWVVLAPLGLLGCAENGDGAIGEAARAPVGAATAKKRAGPEPVQAVSRNGVRYQALHWGKALGLGQNGGYIVAVDEQSGEPLWRLQVYEVRYDGDQEDDKQDVFITRLSVDAAGRRLTVENERGAIYFVDLSTRQVYASP